MIGKHSKKPVVYDPKQKESKKEKSKEAYFQLFSDHRDERGG